MPTNHEELPSPSNVRRLGQYELGREIGRGGMGVVYEANDVAFGEQRSVAVKVLPQSALIDSRRVRRFENEALAASSLKHDNIVRILNRGVQDGQYYFVMDYIEGPNLSTVIRNLRDWRAQQDASTVRATITNKDDLSGDLTTALDRFNEASDDSGHDIEIVGDFSETTSSVGTVEEASGLTGLISTKKRLGTVDFQGFAKLAIQACDALDHAHEMGVVHRDIKPSNLMVDANARLYVTDFGLARMASSDDLTRTGDLLGTLRYMSPEQALAKRVVVDHRTDIYSLGITLYELVTLRKAFTTTSGHKDLLHQVAFTDPKLPRSVNPSIPYELETVILHAIQKKPNDRYATAKEMGDDLRRFLEKKPIAARRPTPIDRAARWSRDNSKFSLTIFASVVCVALCAMAAWFLVWQSYLSKAELAQRAVNALRISEGLRLLSGSANQLPTNPGLALILATMGHEHAPSREANNAIQAALEANHELKTLQHPRAVRRVRFSPNGQHVATIEQLDDDVKEQPLRIWDTKTGNVLHILVEPGRSIVSANYGAAGRFLLTTAVTDGEESETGRVAVWNTSDLAHPVATIPAANVDQKVVASISPIGEYIVTGSDNGGVVVWDTDGTELEKFEEDGAAVINIVFCQNGKHFATLDAKNQVDVWEIAKTQLGVTIKQTASVQVARQRNSEVHLELSHQGDRLLTASWGTATLWNTKTSEQVIVFERKDRALLAPNSERVIHYSLASLEFTSRDTRSPEDGDVLTVDRPLQEVQFSSQGQVFAAYGSRSNEVTVHSVTSGETIVELLGHSGWIRDAAFTADGRRLATASFDKTVRIWKLKSLTDESTLTKPSDGIHVTSSLQQDVILSERPRPMLTRSAKRDPKLEMPGRLVGIRRILDDIAMLLTDDKLSVVSLSNGEIVSAALSKNNFDDVVTTASESHAIVRVRSGRNIVIDIVKRTTEELADVGAATCLASHPDKDLIAIGQEDGKVSLWSPEADGEISVLSHTSQVLDVAIDAQNDVLIAMTQNEGACVWSLETNEQLRKLEIPARGLLKTEIAPDRKSLLVARRSDSSTNVVQYNLETGDKLRETTVPGTAQMRVHESKSLAVLGSERGLFSWNLADSDAKELATYPISDLVLSGNLIHAGVQFRFLGRGDEARVGDAMPRVVQFDALQGTELDATICTDVPPTYIYLMGDSKETLFSGQGFSLLSHPLTDLQISRDVAVLPTRASFIGVSAKTSETVVVQRCGAMTLWNAAGKPTPLLPNLSRTETNIATMSSDGGYLVTADESSVCRMIDLKERKVVGTLQPNEEAQTITMVHTLGDGSRVLIVRPDELTFWRPIENEGAQKTRAFSGEDVTKTRFADAGLATVGTRFFVIDETVETRKRTLRLFESGDATPTTTIEDTAGAAFSPDGSTLLARRGNLALMVNAKTGKIRKELPLKTRVLGARFSNDGQRFATIELDRVTLWSTKDLTATLDIIPRDFRFVPGSLAGQSFGFSADGEWFVWKEIDRRVRRWSVDPASYAATRLPGTLTSEQRRRFQVDLYKEAIQEIETAPED